MNLAVVDHRSWMMRTWRRTRAKPVMSLPNAPMFLIKQSSPALHREKVPVEQRVTPHCRRPTSNEWQPVYRCFLGTAMYPHIWRKLAIDCHHGDLSFKAQDNLYTHARSYSIFGGPADKWCTMSKPSLRTCTRSSWDVCNRHWRRRSQHHVARMARDTIRQLGCKTLCHPPNTLDLAWTSFANEADLQKALTDVSKAPDFFPRQGIAQLETR